MLEVSKSSWHYRLYKSVWEPEPKNLCLYFWGTASAPLMHVAIFIGSFLVGLSNRVKTWLVAGVLAVFTVWILGLFVFAIIDNPWNAIIIPAGVLGVLTILAVIVLTVAFFEDRQDGETGEKQGDSSSRLAWEFFKARKQKVCPLIKVVD